LGSGSSSSVRLAIEKNSNKKFALKLINKTSLDSSQYNSTIKEKHFKREVEVLQQIESQHIIKMYHFGSTYVERDFGGNYVADYLCLEYAEHGSLFDFLYYEKQGFSEPIARNLFLQIINGLEACHNAGISHGDLKPENILVHSDWTLKLCDFGNSFTNCDIESENMKNGTRSYSGPEVWQVRNKVCGFKADVYSIGIILFILVTGSMPFGSSSILDRAYQKVRSKNYNELLKYYNERIQDFDKFSTDFKELFISLVKTEPTERPFLQEIRKNKWLNNEVATNEEVIKEFQKREKNINL